MIDKIRIRFEPCMFNGSLRQCFFKKVGKKYLIHYVDCIRVNSRTKIWILQSRISGQVTIVGSLRKWYYGDNSLLDFNKGSFMLAIQRLANILEMPLSDLYRGKITYMEMGLNIRTRIVCSRVIRKMFSYKTFHREDYYQKQGSVYFGYDMEEKKNSVRTLIAYDKCKEIVNKQDDPIVAKRLARAYNVLRKHHYYFTRIEYKMKGQKSLKSVHINMRTLKDLVVNWNTLYFAWTCHTSKILISAPVRITENMTHSERKRAEMLQNNDYQSVIEKALAACSSRTRNGLKAKRYRIRKGFCDIILMYGLFS